MTHKHVMFCKGKKARRLRHPSDDDYDWGSRRALLPSSNDVERMALESSRAQVNRRLNAGPKEFGSCYRTNPKYAEPPFSITSHTERKPKVVKVSQMSAFPSLVSEIRFSDHSDNTTPTSSQTDVNKERKFTCRCEHCSKPRCPAKIRITEKKTVFKDNVMTFSDRCTMTPKMVNNDCGYTESSIKVECGISPFRIRDVAVRDTDERTSSPERMCRPPTPILRRPCSPPMDHNYDQRRPCAYSEESDNHECEPECSVPKLRQLRSLKRFFMPKDSSREHSGTNSPTRFKNIYNEGISDVIASRLPASCNQDQDSVLPDPIPDCSRTCLMSKCPEAMHDMGNYIPFSHRHNSKYHSHCKIPNDHECSVSDRQDVGPCPKAERKICRRTPIAPCRTPYVRLPRKVLASERDIEGFIYKTQCNKCKKR